MGLQLGKDMALKDPKRGMMYFLIYLIFLYIMGFQNAKICGSPCAKEISIKVGSIDQPLTTCSTSGSSVSRYTWLHHAPECPGLFLDNLGQMHIGLIDAVKLDLNLLQKFKIRDPSC